MSSSREESPDWLRSFQAPTTHTTLTLSSDSDSDSSPNRNASPVKVKQDENGTDSKGQSSHIEEEPQVEERRVSSSSRLPLVLSDKVNRSKALVECEGDSIDLSGDVGAVGRVVIPEGDEMYLDLKGTIYRTTIVPSRTFCVVNFGQSEAKIEAIMNDFIQLKPQSENVFEAETMVEGTLDGFYFDSEDDIDHKTRKPISHPENEGEAEKSGGVKRKRGKTARGGKPQPAKQERKKSRVSNKGRTKK